MSDSSPDDLADARAFLLWARDHGFAFETIVLGRVQLIGTRDLIPSIAAQARAMEDMQRRDAANVGPGTIYEGMPGYEEMAGRTVPA